MFFDKFYKIFSRFMNIGFAIKARRSKGYWQAGKRGARLKTDKLLGQEDR